MKMTEAKYEISQRLNVRNTDQYYTMVYYPTTNTYALWYSSNTRLFYWIMRNYNLTRALIYLAIMACPLLNINFRHSMYILLILISLILAKNAIKAFLKQRPARGMKMTGTFNRISEVKQQRIKELTLKNIRPAVIAERLGIRIGQVHYFQKKFGLRK